MTKPVGFTQEQYDEITAIGKRCGFDMEKKGRNGQRAKFLLIAARIAEIELSSLKRREDDPGIVGASGAREPDGSPDLHDTVGVLVFCEQGQ